MGRAWQRGWVIQMGWESCWYPHSLFIVLVPHNNPSDLLRRSKRRVRLMSQMMAELLHLDFVRLVLDPAAGMGVGLCVGMWLVCVCRDGMETCGSKRCWDGMVFNQVFNQLFHCGHFHCVSCVSTFTLVDPPLFDVVHVDSCPSQG